MGCELWVGVPEDLVSKTLHPLTSQRKLCYNNSSCYLQDLDMQTPFLIENGSGFAYIFYHKPWFLPEGTEN